MASFADAKATADDGAADDAAAGSRSADVHGKAIGGQKVECTLRTGTTRTGRLWCMERVAGVCILDCPKESSTPANTMVRLVRISHVKEKGFKVFKERAKNAPTGFKDVALPPVDPELLGQRYRDAVARQQKRVAQIGRGVSKEAQHVFDQLSKTLDCRWKDQTILVNHLAVKIAPPYGAANVSGRDPKAKQRVKMMVTKFLETFKASQA